MTLFSWTAALFVGAIAVPLLLLLYFLKLRRQERKVSSTLLWKKAVQDLQVNAPFQKLRRNLLLFLQLAILLAVLFALANPVANFLRQPERNIVLLVDRSGSMKTDEGGQLTRLDLAKDAARQFVANLPDDSRAMVIGFADRANVVCSFTNDKRRLAGLIDEIEPTEGPSKIGEALQLAVAYSTSLVDIPGVATPEAALQGSADIELFSDGRIADAQEEYVTRGRMRYYRIGEAVDNVGIVAFNVRRSYETPGSLSVFVEVENFGPAPVRSDVSLLLDGRLVPGPGSIQEVALGAAAKTATQPGDGDQAGDAGSPPSRQAVLFELSHDAGGVLQVKLHREDALMIDNVVSSPIDPPREVRVLAVGDRSEVRYFLDKGFQESLAIRNFKTMSSAEYESAGESDLVVEGRSAYDLVVLDGHDTDKLPPGSYLFFGCLPKVEGFNRGEDIEGQAVVLWDERHPLLRSVQLDNVYVAKWKRLTLPVHAVRLVEGEDSVLMSLVTDQGHRYLVCAFDLLESDFPLEIAFPVFLQNAVTYLAAGGLLEEGRLLKPGDTMTAPVPPGAETATIRRPDGSVEELDVRDHSKATYARTHQTGVYRAEFDDRAGTVEAFAVNVLDFTESNIAPASEFTIGAEQVASIGGQTKENEPLWPWAVAAALAVLLFEWWVYNRRVMI